MSEAVDGRFAFTTETPMVWANLHELKAYSPKGKPLGEPKYNATFVFSADHPDLTPLKGRAMQIARAKWPNRDIGAEFKAEKFHLPFASGNKMNAEAITAGKRERPWLKDICLVRASTKNAVQLCGIENGKYVIYEGAGFAASKPKFYSGVLVLAQINLVAYDGVGQKPGGVTAYLQMVLTTGKGERIGGGDPAEVFKGYIGRVSTENPNAGQELDDEIPF